jgi:hypothetical protein
MIDFLLYKHDEYQEFNEYLTSLSIASLGGYRANTKEYKMSLLKDSNDKPIPVKEGIAMSAYFDSRIADIIHLLISHLFKDKATYQGSKDNFWIQWFENCDRNNNDFHSVLKETFLQALVQKTIYIQVDTQYTETTNKKQQLLLGGNNPFLIMRKRQDVWDWANSENGLSFIKIHSYHKVRQDTSAILFDCYHEFIIY